MCVYTLIARIRTQIFIHLQYYTNSKILSIPIVQTALRLWQSPQMSFRGAKRRGNPLNRNANTVAIVTDRTCSHNLYRAENLCYQFEQGQNLLPQFRKIVCLVLACSARKWNIPNLPFVIPSDSAGIQPTGVFRSARLPRHNFRCSSQ